MVRISCVILSIHLIQKSVALRYPPTKFNQNNPQLTKLDTHEATRSNINEGATVTAPESKSTWATHYRVVRCLDNEPYVHRTDASDGEF
jgi:hypothetical protein